MELTSGGRLGTAAPHNHGVRAGRTSTVHAFWIVLEGSAWGLPLTVSLSDGTEAMALFSGEEEAMMFCHFCEEGPARRSGGPPRARSSCCCTVLGVQRSTWPSTLSPRSLASGSWGC
jgi:hypothetical protein